ncbi:hypothetical protein [Nocardia sp. NBC_01388]|uniref:hypothetical protein n=1 Tax=Nocardia sp. NBC_01388 TaxID=2903596 RepID=UPI0032541D31
MNHHTFFGRLRRIDNVLRWWNLMLLLGVSIVPFPTAVVADDVVHGMRRDSATAVTLYGIVGVLMTIFVGSHVVAAGEAAGDVPPRIRCGLRAPRRVAGLAGDRGLRGVHGDRVRAAGGGAGAVSAGGDLLRGR